MSNQKKLNGDTPDAAPAVDVGALIAAAKLPERTVELCLRGDLQAQFEDLERQLQAESAKPRTSLADGGITAELAERIEALREEMAASTVVFRARALPRRQFLDLLLAHPPREDNDRDKALGHNYEAFEPALIKACVWEPELSDEQWTHLLDEVLTANQYGNLYGACQTLNLVKVDVPFSLASSMRTRPSDES